MQELVWWNDVLEILSSLNEYKEFFIKLAIAITEHQYS